VTIDFLGVQLGMDIRLGVRGHEDALDVFSHAIGHEGRRRLLAVLARHGATDTPRDRFGLQELVDELASPPDSDVVAKPSTGEDLDLVVEDANVDERTTRILLHHAHLPKLDAIGLLRYDSQVRTVHPEYDAIRRVVEMLRSN
jgi:hypothetical protein